MNARIFTIAAALAVVLIACSKSDNPVAANPGHPITLTLDAATPISATLHWTTDSAGAAESRHYILVRTSAGVADTVYNDSSALFTVHFLDTNHGAYLAPSTNYSYRCFRVNGTNVLDSSALVAASTGAGEYFPLVSGSVWVYKGWMTDTLTGARMPGTDYVAVDSLVGPVTFQGYSDVYQMLVTRTAGSNTAYDTLHFRVANGDYWEYGRYGFYADRKTWLNKYRFGTGAGRYVVKDTMDTVVYAGQQVQIHEVGLGTLTPTGSITVPQGAFTTQTADLNLVVDGTISLFPVAHDTVPAGTARFANGFGIVEGGRASFLAKGTGVKQQRNFGNWEVLAAIRIKY